MENHEVQIIRIPLPTPTLKPYSTTNSYLIGNRRESILVDAGYDRQETKDMLEQAVEKYGLAVPDKIILTHAHRDHAPGVRQLNDWAPVVYCHREEQQDVLKAIAPWGAVSALDGDEVLRVAGEEIRVLHTPGHTAGHISLYLPASGILIAGDNIVEEGTTWIGAPGGDMLKYLDSLRSYKSLKLSKIGPGHGDWVLNPYEKIDFVIRRRLDREKQITDLLKKHGRLTSVQLTELIYEDTIHPSVFHVAQLTVEAHLQKLMREGAVFSDEENYKLA